MCLSYQYDIYKGKHPETIGNDHGQPFASRSFPFFVVQEGDAVKGPSKLVLHQILGGRYRVLQCIGEGGMSYVYLVEDLKLVGKRWAVKETQLAYASDQTTIMVEVEMLSQLSHPHLPHIVDYFAPDADGYMYLVMDYVAGETLAVQLQRMGNRMPCELIFRYAIHLCEVLIYLHGRTPAVIYRDLKPSNVMIDVHGQVRLIDFGIARSFKKEQADDTVCLGTLGFAAPEQYAGQQSDARSDLYGLGALMLYLMTGGRTTLWEACLKMELEAEMPEGLYQLVEHLLQQDMKRRPASAQEVLKRLQQLSADNMPRGVMKLSLRATVTIAIMGISAGAGVTHTSLLVAHYLSVEKLRVAIVEAGPSDAFRRIYEMYAGECLAEEQRLFTIRGIDYYPYSPTFNFTSLLHAGYEAVVLDLGVMNEHPYEEFRRANLSIMVASGAEWKQHELRAFVEQMSCNKDVSHWHYVLPLSERQTVQDVKKSTLLRYVHRLPYHSDPFRTSEEMKACLRNIIPLHFIPVPKERVSRRFSFFRRM